MKKRIIFATHNPHKASEMNAILGEQYEVLSLDQIGITEDIPENGATFRDNALIKAKYVFDKMRMDCFADDSGLLVDALNGEPGVLSARYAGEPADTDRNNAKLLDALKDKSDRTAHFHTSIAAFINGEILFFDGRLDGRIIDEYRGKNGFGYDPIFMPDGYDMTLAEISPEEKNRISHRAKATAQFINALKQITK